MTVNIYTTKQIVDFITYSYLLNYNLTMLIKCTSKCSQCFVLTKYLQHALLKTGLIANMYMYSSLIFFKLNFLKPCFLPLGRKWSFRIARNYIFNILLDFFKECFRCLVVSTNIFYTSSISFPILKGSAYWNCCFDQWSPLLLIFR